MVVQRRRLPPLRSTGSKPDILTWGGDLHVADGPKNRVADKQIIPGAKLHRQHLRQRRKVKKCRLHRAPVKAPRATGMNESNPLADCLLQPLAFLSVQELPE